MKNFIKIMMLLVLGIGWVACHDNNGEYVRPTLEVNYFNVSGIWRLFEWNGEKMNDSRYYYVVLNRKEENGKRFYEIYTNLNSATSQHISGDFELKKDEEREFDLITGTYHYQLSTNDGWEHDYVITGLYEDAMEWMAVDDPEEVRKYIRCEEIPADICQGTRCLK